MEIIILILAIIFWSIYYIFQARHDVAFIKEVGLLVDTIEPEKYQNIQQQIIAQEKAWKFWGSWKKYKYPLKNLLFLEFEEIFIIDQKQLPFYKIFVMGLLLCKQGTNLSPKYFRKYIINVVDILCSKAKILINNITNYSKH